MTAQTTFSLEAIDAALAAAGPSLGPDEQRLAAAVLRLLSAGEPVSITAAAAAALIPGPQAITYRIGADGVVTSASHPDAVLSFLRPGQPWDGAVITTCCHYVWHFTGPATAQQWTTVHPGTFVLSLGDAAELARRQAARAFGAGYARRQDGLTEDGQDDD